ncbi:aspartyl/asparaginyl beta-hydroxylase domain-containing protein [Undibacterium flavidum]|uniref:Aspartyl/asparaginyl beta-hydroxylase domain-containing protein n=1 Tax=Undibacterium flavidum TaxID=2762297 RepID=A0ABR6YAL1_9BURK|nr:aspartyl/asparaginyl beta-hydroxylase domain-containing protein [Undibacterium flavidum]MBC3873671.1 aspartyl/asparaginyl beta-hydroxylase domain-containing protein [Undibacterium flavidum]
MSSATHLKLPMSFDVQLLQKDLARAAETNWIRHFNTRDYEKEWSCIPLRSVDGRDDHILPLDNANFQDTEILRQCPYFQYVIAQFACEKTSIRLMSLEAGGEIKEHRDQGTSFEDGITRLHIPIQTTSQVLFRLDGTDVHFSAGDTWYLNANCLHGVRNHSPQARVHLMLDCISNDWLHQLFLDAGWVAPAAPRYPDPNINDANVADVIAALRRSSQASALTLANELEAIAANTILS